MRRLPPRTQLPNATITRLAREAARIAISEDSTSEADQRYEAARRANWFRPVIAALRALSGLGERCMFCSGSESSQVEHFWPKRHFPLRAMEWENFLWVCGICNLNKGDRFAPGIDLINPIGEKVWQFCFIDEYGNLGALWRTNLNDVDLRGDLTIKALGLNRDALQLTRQTRLDDLKRQIGDSLSLFENGTLTLADLRTRLEDWRRLPFQPDVADYFLNGPGSIEQPFSTLLEITGG